MKLLLDECIPWKVKFLFTAAGHRCDTVREAGLSGKENGELLALIEDQFDVLITIDKNIPYQQNMTGRKLSLLIIRPASNDTDDIHPCGPCRSRVSAAESLATNYNHFEPANAPSVHGHDVRIIVAANNTPAWKPTEKDHQQLRAFAKAIQRLDERERRLLFAIARRNPLHVNIAHLFYSVMKTRVKITKIFLSHRHLRMRAAHRTPPIDSFEQHG